FTRTNRVANQLMFDFATKMGSGLPRPPANCAWRSWRALPMCENAHRQEPRTNQSFEGAMTAPPFVVGMDLGTTNSALAYLDTGRGEDAALEVKNIAQTVHPGTVEDRPLLPSFLYMPGPNELPAGSLSLPWDDRRDFAVGEFARNHGSQVP